jgi:3-hydroxyacyl-[acyl-carrier-protein] dehydratase
MILNLEQIKNLIPHRDPFLFLDSCEIIDVGISGIGYMKFSKDEYFFKGHFPNNPIVPGVILVESLAQTAGVIVSNTFEKNTNQSVLFMSISKAKFRKPVYPEDNIELKVSIMNKVRAVYKFYGEIIKNDIKVCEAEFSAMIFNS